MDEDDDPRPGTIQNKNGCLKLFQKVKDGTGGWIELTNFTMVPKFHASNKIEKQGQFFIFECHLPDGITFHVPMTIADMDSNDSVYTVISKYKREHGATIDKLLFGKTSNKAQLHRFLRQMIKKYQSGPSQERHEAIVSKDLGFTALSLTAQNGQKRTETVFVVGKDSVLPVSPTITADELKQIRHFWIGSKDNNFVLPTVDVPHDGGHGYFNSLIKYHNENKGSVIAVFCYTWLSMFKKQLQSNGMRLGICHLLGDINVGKSALRHQLEATFPRQKTPAGLIIKEEETFSVHKLFEKVTEERPLIIQDPPASDMDKINIFLDMFFENKIERTSATKKTLPSDQPRCGALFVWPNEYKKLPKLTATAVTKGVYLIHGRNNLSCEEFAEQERLCSIEKGTAPLLFPTFLQSPDFLALETEMESLIVTYHQVLAERYSDTFLNEHQRMLKQYALVESASQFWLLDNGFSILLKYELHSYFLNVCIPYMFEILENKKRKRDNESDTPAIQLANRIGSLSDLELMSQVAVLFENEKTHFGFSLPLTNSSNATKMFVESLSIYKERKSLLHPKSKVLWFRRHSKGFVYGMGRKIEVHVCPVSGLPKELKDILTERLQNIMPGDAQVNLSQNVKELLDSEFDEVYKSQSQSSDKTKDLIRLVHELSKTETNAVLKFARSLLGKRAAQADERNTTNDSSDGSDGDGSEGGDKQTSEHDDSTEKQDTNDGRKDVVPEGEVTAGCSGAAHAKQSSDNKEKKTFNLRSRKMVKND